MLINLHRLIRYAFIEACLIGIFSALAALLLENGIGWLGGYRLKLADAWSATIALPLYFGILWKVDRQN